ncbi:peptide chain release factor N(5)-glutamine methyltransferase [Candidatus Mycoplasma pogonae]
MIDPKILLKEKQRYNLPLEVSQQELKLLAKDTPVQKIIGYIEMQNVVINLQHQVLIPRYETEEVILKALEYIRPGAEVLDLCCGSGFIGLALAKNSLASKVILSDIDPEAIAQSQYNADLNYLNVEIIHSDLFANINQKFDVIVSNPPYIPNGIKLSASVLNFEPHHALFASENGNYFYQKIISQANQYLKPGGLIIFEISHWNLAFFKNISNCQIFKDINDKPRIAVVSYS